ncbi:hypothetical protein [Bradyrhizobium sp. BR 10289]|uniref:hypothetical protein n=1 Tax=Bradyrhizobium sp. BR 10289 TaxID=2749993 RepID=UPI001C6481CC|nr:hypothetical protein [Bradyrhizobium sp. BR 10289]MBW7970959.1 hypothetical protein [Bradyrhizobium sp. BR 10289]
MSSDSSFYKDGTGNSGVAVAGPSSSAFYADPDAAANSAASAAASAAAAAASATLAANPNSITLPQISAIKWSANGVARGRFLISVSDAGSGADPHMYIGYNLQPGSITLDNSADRGAILGFEADYNDGSGHNKLEIYLQYQIANGWDDGAGHANYRRPLMVQYDKVTNLPTVMYLSSAGLGFQFGWLDGTGSVSQEQVVGKTKMTLVNNQLTLFNVPGGANPALTVDSSNATPETGLYIASRPNTGGVHLGVTSPSSVDAMYIDGKGSNGPVVLNQDTGGPVLAPNGSAGAPSWSFISDQNTGVYNVSADVLGLVAGGSLGLQVGTSGPSTSLTYKATGAAATAAHHDVSGQTPISVNNASNAPVTPASTGGVYLLFITETAIAGGTALFMLVDTATPVLISQQGTNWQASSSPTKFGIAWNSTRFSIYNNAGSTGSFKALLIKLN